MTSTIMLSECEPPDRRRGGHPSPLPGTGPGARGRPIGLDSVLVAVDLVVLTAATSGVPLGTRLAFVAATVAMIAGLRGYQHRLALQISTELPRLVLAVAASAGVVGAVRPGIEETEALLSAGIPAALGLVAARVATWFALVTRRRRGLEVQRAIVVGAGVVGRRVARHLQEHPEYGLEPLGFVDDAHDEPVDLPLLGRVSELSEVVQRFDATQVIVAFGVTGEESLVTALRACHERDVDFWVVPRLFEMGLSGRGSDTDIRGLPLIHLRRPALRTAQWRLKRVFDTSAAALALVVVSPLFLVTAAAVAFSSPGPVFFRQRRVGQRGVPFDVLKFRTMLVNDDEATTWDVTADDRVTPLGRILRPASLDELPQLLNVLRGDMSLVGPRPERPHFVEQFERLYPRYGDRHRVPVGITGLAQVNGLRGDTSIEERAFFDNYYIENWSLWNDIVILLRTVLVVLRPPASVRITEPTPAAPLSAPVPAGEQLIAEAT